MKKALSFALALCMALSLCVVPSMAAGVAATKTASKVTVDGAAKSFDAYTIASNNYFKLRDIAMVLNGTAKQFEVTFDGAKNAIDLISGKPYTAVGGEMTASTGGASQTATASTAKIYVDGKEVALTAYTISGNNYFKLRDLGQTFDFGVEWDGAANSIAIKSTVGYTPEKPTAGSAGDGQNNVNWIGTFRCADCFEKNGTIHTVKFTKVENDPYAVFQFTERYDNWQGNEGEWLQNGPYFIKKVHLTADNIIRFNTAPEPLHEAIQLFTLTGDNLTMDAWTEISVKDDPLSGTISRVDKDYEYKCTFTRTES